MVMPYLTGDVPDDAVGFAAGCEAVVQEEEVHCTRGSGCPVPKTPSLTGLPKVQPHCWYRGRHRRRRLRFRSMIGH